MNFDYTDAQQALRDLTAQIVGDKVDHASLRALEASESRVDRDTWEAMAEAGVLGALLPEAVGGAGVGLVGVGAVLEVVGRHAAAVPVLATVALGALPIAEFGTDEQKLLLDDVTAGTILLSAALAHQPAIEVTTDGDEHLLTGSVSYIPSGLDAGHVLVPVSLDAALGVAIIDCSLPGVALDRIDTTTGYPEARLVLDGLAISSADLLGGELAGAEQLPWMHRRADIAICALTTGLCDGAIELLSTYANQRQQFDRVIASFQAVSQRAGDSYIDAEAVRLTARQAAWRVDAGLEADREIAIARWWSAEAGHRIVHASTHIHGGVGVDRDYPLHRHFLLSRQLELTLGNAEEQLATLGSLIAG